MTGATVAGYARPAGCAQRDSPSGCQCDDEERDATSRGGLRVRRSVRAHHSGGELADRPCRHGMPAGGTLPRSGGAGAEGALGRDHGRCCARSARLGPAPPRRCRVFARHSRRCHPFGGAGAAGARYCLGGRIPAVGIRRSRSLHAARAARVDRCRRGVERGRACRRLGRVSVARFRLARLPAGPDRRESMDGAALDPVRGLAAATRRAPRLRVAVTPAVQVLARGVRMSAALYDTLRAITTATITTMLLKKGIRRCWMNGPRPLVSGGARVVGPAFTLRFVPVREDLATPESWAKPVSTRGAIEAMPEGCIAVADAMGVTSAGIFGDILTMRMAKRKVAALVTDGVVRDKAGVLASKLPVWCAGAAPPGSGNGPPFGGRQGPIGCGGCAVFPGDVIVCDGDGAVVIPQDLVAFVADEGAEHERMESFIVAEVERGAKLPGLYPMNEETKARYAAWKKT